MRNEHFIVYFKCGKTVFASACNEEEATILAQAAMIKAGFRWKEISKIEHVHSIAYMADTDLIA